MQNKYLKQSIIMGSLLILAICFFTTVLVNAEGNNKPPSPTNTLTREDQFTDVAGTGQSISTVRNNNDLQLIVAGSFGLAVLLSIGLLSFARSHKNAPDGNNE